jgi:hypothetical protein
MRWRAPLLVALLSLFLLEALTGFFIFFAMKMVSGLAIVGFIHTLFGLFLIPLFVVYQIRHFNRVKNLKGHLHYNLGLASATTFLILLVSGLPILPFAPDYLVADKLIRLVHVVSSFGFLICLAGHLILVARSLISAKNQDFDNFIGHSKEG